MVTEKKPDLDEVKDEVQKLNLSLKELGDKKESTYKEKNELDVKLNNLIESANKLKVKKDEVDKKISELKKLREEKNRNVQNLINELQNAKKKLGGSKRQLEKRKQLKKEIRNLEFVVQTEVLNFGKEKEYMTRIRNLKKELDELNKGLEQLSDIKRLRNTITDIKKGADEHHANIQESARESSQIFDELTSISKEIGNIKTERSHIRTGLKATKVQMNQLNIALSESLSNLGALPRATGRAFMEGAKAGAEMLAKQTDAVKDKFKKKKRLSKDDILLLQKEAMAKDKKKGKR